MSLTKVTNEVIGLGTITPDKLTQGGPTWSEFGGLSAVAFVGDGSGLTNVFPAVSVVEITDSTYTIRPEDNNFTLVFPQETYIDFQPPFEYQLGHKTALIQSGTGSIIVGGAQNVFGYDRTKGQYSKAFLQLANEFAGWTLYGDLTAQVLPDTSGNDGRATQLAAGSDFAAALAGNALYVTGSNAYGQLGTNSLVHRSTFTRLSGSWTSITAGHFGHISVLSGTDLYATGYNTYGGLGLEDTALRSTFTKVSIPANAKWTAITAGYAHTLALSGTDLYGTGWGAAGQLGLGNIANKSTFTKIPGNWTSTATGLEYSLALSGTDLYGTGGNYYGELGLGDIANRSTFTKIPGIWTGIATGSVHTLALSGTDLYGVGRNDYGQIGIGNVTHRSTFTKIPGIWTGIAAGGSCSFALSGTDLYATGHNNYGNLSIGDVVYRSTFTKVPGSWTAIADVVFGTWALSGTELYAAGYNSSGQLGLGDTANRSTFTRVSGVYIEYSAPALPQFTQIAAGGVTLALSGTDLYTAGEGAALGLGTTQQIATFTKVTIPANAKWTAVAVGRAHSLALSGTDLYVTGYNNLNYGLPLGLGDAIHRSTFTKVSGIWKYITASTEVSLALSSTGDLFYAGRIRYGNLTQDSSVFIKVPHNPSNFKFDSVSIGEMHYFALSGNDLYAAGYNSVGQLGLGDTVVRSTFTKVTSGPGKFTKICVGAYHSVALSGTNLYVCGVNGSGELGRNNTLAVDSFVQIPGRWNDIAAGVRNSYALSGTDLLFTGWNYSSGLQGAPTYVSTFTKIPGQWSSITSQDGTYTKFALSGNNLFGVGFPDTNLGIGRTSGSQTATTFTQVTAVG